MNNRWKTKKLQKAQKKRFKMQQLSRTRNTILFYYSIIEQKLHW